MTDEHDAISNHLVRVTIEGINDALTLSLTNSSFTLDQHGVRLDGDGHPVEGSLTGHTLGKDVDHNAQLDYGLVKGKVSNTDDGRNAAFESDGDKAGMGNRIHEITGEYGKLTIDADGNYTYVVDPSKVASLDEGKSLHESFTIFVRDEHGAYTEQPVDITIKGTYEVPDIVMDHVVVDEKGLDNIADTSETALVKASDGYTVISVAEQGSHGMVSLGTNGQWHYTLKEAIDSGKIQGQNKVDGGDTVKVTIQDIKATKSMWT